LGLSTVRGIVNELGGTITATSTPGQGTTFTMLFCPHVGADAEAGAVGESRGLRGEGHIMVVDDDEGVLHVTARCLSRTGYRVAAFQSSREALDAFQLDPETFDLVLTDQTMPELTGLELSGQVRQLRPEVPIILTSGHGDTIQGADLERIGSCEFLPKPASASGIALAVERGLRRLTPPSTPIAS
jgi:CheY-like chemotaxis protein